MEREADQPTTRIEPDDATPGGERPVEGEPPSPLGGPDEDVTPIEERAEDRSGER